MLSDVLAACFMWIACTMIILAATCSPGWFGDDCSFMCHCHNTNTCNNDGSCINNTTCAIPYFGPMCQYVNLIYWDNAFTTRETFLIDNNDATCNPYAQASSVYVTLSTAYQLKWFRIHFKNTSKQYNFAIKLDDTDGLCMNERRYHISDVIVEVMCEINVLVRKVEIEGQLAPHVCSLYVSLGRNVALKQKTIQSANHTQDGRLGLSSNAVDGNTDQNYTSGSCTRTENNKPFSFWSLLLPRACVLYLIRIFNRNDYAFRLVGFHLFTKNTAGDNVSTFTDGTGIQQAVYNVVLSDTRPVVGISVWQADVPLEPNQHILTLCEVEAYGDVACEDDKFGLQCEKNCRCSKGQVCSAISGACTEVCKPGLFGTNCSQRCSHLCSDAGCATTTGDCLACDGGFKPPNCTEECLDGLYGDMCSLPCSLDCFESTCERTTGYCLLCKGTRTGDLCGECPHSYYGEFCEKKCPANCKNETCNAGNGFCRSCEPGFTGNHCSTEDSLITHLLSPISLSIFMLLVAALTLFLCLKSQQTGTSNIAEERLHPRQPGSS